MSERHPDSESENSYFSTTHKKAAAVVTGLALAAGIGASTANNAEARATAPSAARAERDSDINLRNKITHDLYTGKIKAKILNALITFDTTSDDLKFFVAPEGAKPGGKITEYYPDSRVRHYHWVAKNPVYFHRGKYNWLEFIDMSLTDINNKPVASTAGTADEFQNERFFLNTSHMPKGTKIWTSKSQGETGNLLPAHVDKSDSMVAPGVLPGGAEMMIHFDDSVGQSTVTGLLKGGHYKLAHNQDISHLK